ncbi:hypothetical protein QA641_39225 [Bradyrhizobium sp. CB1650]|uniref:hypothetical protein n=1 Tax=Bradyrhizobium sp. CB1650 TaxID=3039153 RepID=UPI0024360327|nr:hypothetical protein [Bradyrhizobium sp. CB1650]WGD51418.1 hypothetical protein QA641_39225 [Bradyrhizobium sp. CB1650]
MAPSKAGRGTASASDSATRWYQLCICDIVSVAHVDARRAQVREDVFFTEDDMAKKAKKAKKTVKAATKKVAKKTSKKKK